jgi:type III pantothenate kinase
MLLATDVGNTQTVIGLFEGDRLLSSWRIATNSRSTTDELHVVVHQLFQLSRLDEGALDGLALASVVPELSTTWVSLAERMGLDLLVVTPEAVPFLPIRYDNPSEIGADRLADAVAARKHYGAPVVVVDLGTATNIEVIDAQGAFVGGIIAPGLLTSAEALFSGAARLARVDLKSPDAVIGTNTRAAVQSGLLFGEADRIDGLIGRIFDELGYTATVVGTGGLASRMLPLSRTIDRLDVNLTLEGLRLIYRHNRD